MENKYKFAVELPSLVNDPRGFYKKGLVDMITKRYPNLTVAGLDNPDVKRGIQYAGPGSLITFGTAKNHDINWVERPDYAREKGYKPVYDLIKDWSTIATKIAAFSSEKARLEEEKRREEARRAAAYRIQYVYPTNYLYSTYVEGIRVDVYPTYIKVGNKTIPTVNASSICFPTLTLSEINAINFLVYSIR